MGIVQNFLGGLGRYKIIFGPESLAFFVNKFGKTEKFVDKYNTAPRLLY